MGIPPECWEGPFRPMVARPSTVDELLKGALTNCDTELSRVRGLLGELLAEREGLRVQRDDMAGLILGKDEKLEAMQAALRSIANHESTVPDSHMECDNCKDAFLEDYVAVKRIARASLDRQGK